MTTSFHFVHTSYFRLPLYERFLTRQTFSDCCRDLRKQRKKNKKKSKEKKPGTLFLSKRT